MQVPLLHSLYRHEAQHSIRIPQSGWLHENRPDDGHEPHVHGPVRDTFRRSHRWQRIHRHEDELAVDGTEDKMTHVLLSTAPDDISLYNKPMARNCQIWSQEYELLLDGPQATPADLQRAADQLAAGGLFGYRMIYPAMRVGRHEVYWHRPLVAYAAADGNAALLPAAPLGHLTAYDSDKPRLNRAVEFWPRMLDRPAHSTALRLFTHCHENHLLDTLSNARKLLDTRDLLGRPLSADFARQLLTLPKHETLQEWFQALPAKSADAPAVAPLVEQLRTCVASVPAAPGAAAKRRLRSPMSAPPNDLTRRRTGRRSRSWQPANSRIRTMPTAFWTRRPASDSTTTIATWRPSVISFCAITPGKSPPPE